MIFDGELGMSIHNPSTYIQGTGAVMLQDACYSIFACGRITLKAGIDAAR